MAYMNQETKAKINTALKPVLAKYCVKGSLSVRNHSTIVLTVKSGAIDFIGNMNRVCGDPMRPGSDRFQPALSDHISVNPYWFKEHFDGVALQFLTEAFAALKSGDWYDRSDAMTDYFDTAYYVDLDIGKWDKPYRLEA